MRVKPKGLPDGDCCSPWQKIMERLREVETGLSQRVKKVKVNGTTIYPVNDGEIVLPDYPESGGTVESVTVDGTKYLPDAQGDVGLPNYPPDLSIEVGSLDARLESVEDDVGDLDTAVTGLGNRLDTAEGDIDTLDGSVAGLGNRLDTDENNIQVIAQMVNAHTSELREKPTMYTGDTDPDDETEGAVGDFYLNTADDKLWKCLDSSPGEYEWTEVGGGAGGGCDLNIIRHYRVIEGGMWVNHWYVNGIEVADAKAVYTYLSGLSNEELEKTIVKETAGSGYLFVYDRTQFNRYYFNNVLTVSNPSKTISFYEYYLDSSGWNAGTTNMSFPVTYTSTYLSPQTIASGVTINVNVGNTTPGVVSLPKDIYDAYINGDVTISSPSGRISVHFVNAVTLTTSGQIVVYEVMGMYGLIIVMPTPSVSDRANIVHF